MHSTLSILAVVFSALAAISSTSPSLTVAAAAMPSSRYLGHFGGYELFATPKRSQKNPLGK